MCLLLFPAAEPVFYGNPEKREGFDYTFSDGAFTLTPRSNKAVNLALNRYAFATF